MNASAGASRGKAKRITIELDPTDDPTHGSQQLTLFNGHYDTWCYLPVAGFVQFDAEPEQYLFAYVLRSGNAPAKLGAIGILRRVFERLRRRSRGHGVVRAPRWRLCVSRDPGVPRGPGRGLKHAIAMAGNAVLDRSAEPWMQRLGRSRAVSGQDRAPVRGGRYAAKSWSRERRIVVKAEVVRPRGGPRATTRAS